MKLLTKKDIIIFRKSLGLTLLQISEILNINSHDLYNIVYDNSKKKLYIKNKDRLKVLHEICKAWKAREVGHPGKELILLSNLLKNDPLDLDEINKCMENVVTYMLVRRKANEAHDEMMKKHGFKPMSKEELWRRALSLAGSIC